MSHFFSGYSDFADKATNFDLYIGFYDPQIVSWLGIIAIGLTAYSIAKAIQYLNRMSD